MNVLLLGAGASYGSDTVGTPPMGDALFPALREFNPPGWGALPADMADQFAGDFEAGMTSLADQRPHDLPPLQRAMAAFFFKFAPRTSNIYVNLATRIKQSGWNGAVCTLNYERLIEISSGSAGLRPVIGQASEPGRTIELCMPHGCCHVFCDSARGVAGSVSFAGVNVRTDGPVRVIADPGEFQRRIEGDAFPPVMSYFEPQKRTTAGTSFIESQRTRWTELAASAERIGIVGMRVRPRDSHIWEPLAGTNAHILYCSGHSAAEDYREWARDTRTDHNDIILEGYFADSYEQICDQLGL